MLLPTTCPVCGRPGPAPCAACRAELVPPPSLPPPVGLDSCRALFAYDGPGRELVARFKYRNARASLPWLAASLAAGIDPADVDVVTWVPTTGSRRRRRGYDHARLLAVAVARHLRRPCRPLLVRTPGPAQTGRAAEARRSAPPGFRSRPGLPRKVLLIDDVATTGATLTSAAGALRRAGAVEVRAALVARTPAGVRRR